MTEEILQMEERKEAKKEIDRYRILEREEHAVCDKPKRTGSISNSRKLKNQNQNIKQNKCMKKLKKKQELTGRNQEIVVLRTKKGRCCLTNKKFKIDGQNTQRDYSRQKRRNSRNA